VPLIEDGGAKMISIPSLMLASSLVSTQAYPKPFDIHGAFIGEVTSVAVLEAALGLKCGGPVGDRVKCSGHGADLSSWPSGTIRVTAYYRVSDSVLEQVYITFRSTQAIQYDAEMRDKFGEPLPTHIPVANKKGDITMYDAEVWTNSKGDTVTLVPIDILQDGSGNLRIEVKKRL
jgi:hypothetical protein